MSCNTAKHQSLLDFLIVVLFCSSLFYNDIFFFKGELSCFEAIPNSILEQLDDNCARKRNCLHNSNDLVEIGKTDSKHAKHKGIRGNGSTPSNQQVRCNQVVDFVDWVGRLG
jgi:hypothetical protein